MARWEVVLFYKDNSIEAVPDTWVKKGLCAWPKSSKNVKQLIKNRYKPNKSDFIYYPARTLGTKNFATLAEAQAKLPRAAIHSDLSTEDEVIKEKKKKQASRGLKSAKNTPPLYADICSRNPTTVIQSKSSPIFSNKNVDKFLEIENDYTHLESLVVDHAGSISDVQDDSDNDPNWEIKCLKYKVNDDYSSPEHIQHETSIVLFSPNTQTWKVDALNETERTKLELNDQGPFRSPGKWNISSVTDDKVKLANATRTLNLDENIKIVFDESTSDVSTSKSTNLPFNVNDNTFMPLHDFQKFVFTSLTHFKYDIGAMMHIVKDTNEKVQALVSKSNENNFVSTLSLGKSSLDMNIFPITTEDELINLEKNIDDVNFKNELVCKLSLLVDINNLNTSVRRIISRLCDDTLLLNYSLTGFKHNKTFKNLNIYRVLIDAVRMNIQYSKVPDQKIDVPLRVWLDHSKFRIRDKKEKK